MTGAETASVPISLIVLVTAGRVEVNAEVNAVLSLAVMICRGSFGSLVPGDKSGCWLIIRSNGLLGRLSRNLGLSVRVIAAADATDGSGGDGDRPVAMVIFGLSP